MGESVSIGGITVTQQVLERMFGELRSHHWFGIPATYRPRLSDFRRTDANATTAHIEQVLYEYIDAGDMPGWFTDEYCGGRRKSRTRPVEKVMESSGVPRIFWGLGWSDETRMPDTMRRWAMGINEVTAPWLWVTCEDGMERGRSLAHLIMEVAEATGDSREIRYTDSRDLCERVNAASNFGKDSKLSLMDPLKECFLLVMNGLGIERRGRAELETMATVLNARRDAMLPTVLASGLPPKDLMQAYGKSDYERAKDLGSIVSSGLRGYGTRDTANIIRLIDSGQ